MVVLHPDWSAFYSCSVAAAMEAHVASYAEACVDQIRSSCCFLVLLLLADRQRAAVLELGNEELMACLPVPQGSSDSVCPAETPGNQNNQCLWFELKTKLENKTK
jgi:hypothetical protein